MVAHGAPGQQADPRAEGPALVWQGETGAPVVLVLDPAGEAKHEDVPPTWAELSRNRQIGWCRVATEGALTEAEELLSDPGALGAPIDLVTSGPASLEVLDLACRHPDTVRSLLLVDPEATDVDHGRNSAPPGNRHEPEEATRRRELEAAGVTVEVVARSFRGDRDRIDPPLPLGHPEVATAVRDTVAALDAR
ncbi:hypothetical protein [Qaidamihabitans albus]|uniref:hypothetical protein n=1 Tax=Qaidamihabitans albus TaxID=2795733 RepID=UPI0018F1A32F|nr:hypothetical protein [Qaidamihabitans albus]